MVRKSVIVALLAVISAVGWNIARDLRANRRADPRNAGIRDRSPRNTQADDMDEGLLEAAMPGGQMPQDEALEYGWTLAYEDALETARSADKPLMVVLRCVP